MKLEKANNRDKKHHKAQHGMVVSNKSIFILDKVSTGKRKRKRKLGLDK